MEMSTKKGLWTGGFLAVALLCALQAIAGEAPALVKPDAQTFRPSFKKVFIVVYENVEAEDALKQPYFQKLLGNGAYLDNFFALERGSLPNYVAMVSGDLYGVDGDSADLNVKTIVDLLEEKGMTWKSYSEDYPGNCFVGADTKDRGTRYVRKHQPFINFKTIREKPNRCKLIVPATELSKDIENDTVPTFSLYIPNTLHNGHDRGAKDANEWLEKTFAPLIEPKDSKLMKDMLFVVTFDEGKKGKSQSARNHIYTLLYGDSVIPGKVSTKRYDFYNLLKTVEVGLGLGTLTKNDAKAEPITEVWR